MPYRERMERVSLGEVAREAGVSKGTASKVFNGRHGISADTADRVRAVAGRLGYVAAERVRPDGPPTVWVAFDTLANHYAATVLDGLLAEVHALGAVAVIARWGDARGPAPRPATPAWMEYGHAHGADAFLLITTPADDAQARTADRLDTPLVVMDPSTSTPAGVRSVGATNWRGGMQATEHLLGLGHRRIAFVGAPFASTPGEERRAGYAAALAAAGLPVDPRLTVPGSFRFEDGLAVTGLLRGPEPPTAVFGASDAVALGVLEAARREGLRVPADLSVIGFDDSYAASSASPPLTTINQPLAEMGHVAVRAALAGVRGEVATSAPVQLGTRLVVRASTAPPPA
ncbi:LacI family transcriptional regulator [Tersicoccus solisilvae]|uniref:LacI family transcriptional regulator n=2 Tax=Tersicoccus solisilvae TaxID=1882339 RepID=A0ABQ1P159_9MICC|nr:LacI family transcriptional regulator [Tersicoccus solisilvae]